ERVRPLGSQDIRPDRPRARGINGDFYEIEKPIDLGEIREKLNKLLEDGIEALAVVLMHAYAFPAHELEIGALAEELGFRQVSLSSETMPRIKIVDRGQTTCVDAYLTPLLRDYREGFRSGFQNREPDLFFMRSDGGLVRAEVFTGSQAILSGPAGGVVGFARTVGRQEPRRPVIGFDMGGTSTDVSRFGGEFEWVHEAELAGVHLQVPQLDIRTVAAGGGSRLFYRNGMFAVGPESSGADPGPVCYRRGGPLSLTDANLLLGRLLPDYFPQVFGPGEDQPLDLGATRAAFEELTRQIQADRPGPSPRTPEEVAYGFVQVANETMARPIREVSVSRGYDLQDHVLACFGGAGGQHACALARVLGISRIFIHRFAGILSAYGLGLADVATEKQQPAAEVLGPQTRQKLLERLDALAADALQELRRQGSFQTEVRRYLHLRYRGTDTAIMVPEPPDGDWERAFLDHHRREFGFELEKREIRVDDLRVRAVGRCQELQAVPLAAKESPTPPETDCPCYFEGGWRKTPVFRLERLGAGETIPGPAILIHPTSTLVVEPECTARITRTGDVEIDVSQEAFRRVRAEDDPVQLAVFGNRFMSIAEQMGRTLQRTAISTNIKERQDYSCAVFGPAGDLVANAPHQPVHLGAMGEAVRRQWALQGPSLEPGDVWVTNHPVEGGSHLPDITVITPEVEGNQPVFFVANRGHHAEIGGITPGSMPPFSTGLEEEGACIKSFKLVAQGIFQEQGIARILTTPSGSGPSSIPGTRALADNISDLKAQAAANQKGIQLLREMAGLYSLETVQAFMGYLQKNAEASVR
ncbi:MAG: 5-oxoprolinase, partial [Nitrospinaceae bacterium]|nr:5-oxoprolinase [Nitrospinaceae bacterium]